MYMPDLYKGTSDLFDDFFNFAWPDTSDTERKLYGKRAGELMKTDVRETSDGYEVMVDLPGFKKDEIEIELKDGNMTISAAKAAGTDEKKNDGKYIRRERYSGNVSRSFYVGEDLTENDIRASFENGILTLFLPKKEAQPKQEVRHMVAID